MYLGEKQDKGKGGIGKVPRYDDGACASWPERVRPALLLLALPALPALPALLALPALPAVRNERAGRSH